MTETAPAAARPPGEAGTGDAAAVRALAAQAVCAVLHKRRSLEWVLPTLVTAVAPQTRGLLHELCFGTLRHAWRLRALLRPLLRKREKAQEPQVLALMLLGLYQLEHTRIPHHAAVHETVAACTVLDRDWARALVNAVLRRYLRRREELAAALETHERDGLPPWLARALQKYWNETQYRRIVHSWQTPPSLCLRINRRRMTREEYLRQLQEAGIPARPCELAPAGVQLLEWRELRTLPGFADGIFSVQDQGAQRAVPLLGARAGERVLDACAAPGGKSCQLLEECPDLQQLAAVDIRPERLVRVKHNLHRLGLDRESAVELHCADVRRLEDWWDGDTFDRILLDVPCSATGVIRRHPDILHLRRAADIEANVKLQGELLDALWPLLKPGGTLLYASCSLLAAENQLCIASFAKRQRNVECTSMSVPAAVEHLHGYTVLPDAEGGDGLFFARLQRPAPQCKS